MPAPFSEAFRATIKKALEVCILSRMQLALALTAVRRAKTIRLYAMNIKSLGAK